MGINKMKTKIFYVVLGILFILSSISYGGESKMGNNTVKQLQLASDRLKVKYKDEIISEEEAVNIAMEHLRTREYDYEIDWENFKIRLEQRSLNKDGSLSSGFGKKILIWHVWFLPLHGTDLADGVTNIGVDIDAKTGKIFTKYSIEKL